MSRRDVCCTEQHTPLAPHKNRIRRDWMEKIPRHKDIITISHGMLDVAMILRHRGRIQVSDIDPGVRETTEYLRQGCGGSPGDYSDLNILPPDQDIKRTTFNYCMKYGVKRLGAVDVDLACSLVPAWDILKPVLDILIWSKCRCKVLLTFRNGRRDGFTSFQERISWFRKRLPRSVQYVSHTRYASVRVRDNASRSKGSSMCIVELYIVPRAIKKSTHKKRKMQS